MADLLFVRREIPGDACTNTQSHSRSAFVIGGFALRLIISTKGHKRTTVCQRNGVVVSRRDPNA